MDSDELARAIFSFAGLVGQRANSAVSLGSVTDAMHLGILDHGERTCCEHPPKIAITSLSDAAKFCLPPLVTNCAVR